MNLCNFIGNLVANPATLHSGDTTITRFTIAVNRKFSKDGQKSVDYFRVTTFGKTAENCAKYLAKGKKAAVTGSIQINDYEDKDGNKRQSVEITGNEVEFLSPASTASQETAAQGEMRDGLIPVHDDSLPF